VAAIGGDVLLASGVDLSAIWSLLLKELRKYRKLCLSCGGIDFLCSQVVDYALSIAGFRSPEMPETDSYFGFEIPDDEELLQASD
jgi:hypothetical protein